MRDDEYNLQRFVKAQAPVYGDAIADLRRGRMSAPYMAFIFPSVSRHDHDGPGEGYGIATLDEASAYLTVATLGGRYRECVSILFWFADKSAGEVFGEADARKLHSSLTLFAEASNYEPLLCVMLDVWFDNRLDEEALGQLGLA